MKTPLVISVDPFPNGPFAFLSHVVVFCLLCVLFPTNEVKAITPEVFKDLLSNAPTVGQIVVEFAGANQLANANSNSLVGIEYDFKWVGKNLKIGQILLARETHANTTNTLVHEVGDYQGQSWEHSKNRITFFDKDAQLVDDSIGSRFVFQTLLHFGIQYVIPHSISWKYNAFTAMVSVDNHELPVFGNLRVDSNLNCVEGLDYKWNDADISYRIDYLYNGIKDEVQYPSKIVIYGFGAIGNNPLMVFKIKEYLNKPKIAATDLDPNVLFPKAQKVQITKHGLKASFIPAQMKYDDAHASTKARYSVVFIFVLTSGFFVWFIVRSRQVKSH